MPFQDKALAYNAVAVDVALVSIGGIKYQPLFLFCAIDRHWEGKAACRSRCTGTGAAADALTL